jgi:hypothetical protein
VSSIPEALAPSQNQGMQKLSNVEPGGAFVPAWIVTHPTLTAVEKAVYISLSSRITQHGIEVTYGTLAAESGASEDDVVDHLRNLFLAGAITPREDQDDDVTVVRAIVHLTPALPEVASK